MICAMGFAGCVLSRFLSRCLRNDGACAWGIGINPQVDWTFAWISILLPYRGNLLRARPRTFSLFSSSSLHYFLSSPASSFEDAPPKPTSMSPSPLSSPFLAPSSPACGEVNNLPLTTTGAAYNVSSFSLPTAPANPHPVFCTLAIFPSSRPVSLPSRPVLPSALHYRELASPFPLAIECWLPRAPECRPSTWVFDDMGGKMFYRGLTSSFLLKA